MSIDTCENPVDAARSSVRPHSSAELGPKARRELARLLGREETALVARWHGVHFAPARLKAYPISGVQQGDSSPLKESYVLPLLRLLAAHVRTGEVRYRSVYIDELLRFSPHRAAPEVGSRFFRELIPALEAVVLGSVADVNSRAEIGEFLRELHAPLTDGPGPDCIRLLAVGDCLMNELRVFLPEQSRRVGIDVDMRVVYFSAREGRAISTDNIVKYIEAKAADVLAFSFLSYEGLPPYTALLRDAVQLSDSELEDRTTQIVALARQFLNSLRERTDAPFLVHNASGLPLRRWRRYLPLLPPVPPAKRRAIERLNRLLREMVENTPNCILIDEYAVAAHHGLRASARPVIPRSIARHAPFHTNAMGQFLAAPYLEVLRSFHLLRKAKVLLVDFDNTLWDGVMADGPVRHHRERQQLLRRLKDAGILLVGVSKNDPANVRWEEMALQPADFVLLKINWDLKARSIADAAQQLNLGLDSFVLIDDNPVERELVSQQLPQVRTLDPLDPFCWLALELLLSFPNTRDTEESMARTAMYREQAQRREALTKALDYPAMMASLGLQVRFGLAAEADLDRIAELVQRTNQFNTTTQRYSRTQLQALLHDPSCSIYAADLADKFGKLGLVLAVIVKRENGAAILDSFVMSCRAMGFELERLVLRQVLDAEVGAEEFLGKFVPTDRNTPAASLYSSNGFTPHSADQWLLDPTAPRPTKPDWFKVLER